MNVIMFFIRERERRGGRILKGQSKMDNLERLTNKRYRILKGQSKMDNLERLTNKR